MASATAQWFLDGLRPTYPHPIERAQWGPDRKSAKDGAPVLLWLFEKGQTTTAAATTKAAEGNEAVSRGPGPGGASSFCGCGGRTFSGLRGCVRSRRGP